MKLPLAKSMIGLIVACAVVAEARLGDDREQIDARYGQSTGEVSLTNGLYQTVCKYKKSGYEITVAFRDGKCCIEAFQKPTPEGSYVPEKFSQTEIDQLLSANAGNSKWKSTTPVSQTKWIREDDDSMAEIEPLKGTFTFVSGVVIRVQAENDKKADKEKLKGF